MQVIQNHPLINFLYDLDYKGQGGIRERMTAARLGYRTDQRNELEALRKENQTLKERIKQLEEIISRNSR